MNNSFALCAFADEVSTDLKEQITAMKENGIQWLEIRNANGKNISKITKEEATAIRQELNRNEIGTWAIGSPTGKIRIQDNFKPHLDEFQHMLELAEILGASCFRLFSFYGYDGSGAARDEVLLRLSRLLEKAKGSSVILCHENEKDIYGERAEQCLDIHRALPDLKAVFDPANFIQAGQDTLEGWKLLEPYIAYMHVKDALAEGKVVPAGSGIGNLRELIEAYGNLGGKVLSLEPHLTVFQGFAELEEEGISIPDPYAYSSPRAAFDVAVNVLKNLIEL